MLERLMLLGCTLLFIVGCDTNSNNGSNSANSGRENDPDTSRSAEADLELLRSIPNAGSTAIRDPEHSGVVLHDAVRSEPGVNLYTIHKLSRAELIDEAGNVLRSWSHDSSARWERAELLPGGELLAIGADRPEDLTGEGTPDETRYLLRFDRAGELRWKRRLRVHHDIERAPDGRLVVLTLQRKRIPAVNPEVDLRDDVLTIIDEDGGVLEELSMLEAFRKRPDVLMLSNIPPNRLGVVPWVDAFHVNSVEWMSRPELVGRHPIFGLDNVLISVRSQDAIAVVSWTRRELIWAWGRDELIGPHDARVLDNGHLLIFDNGIGRGFSRVVEVDPLSGKIVWEYRATPPDDFYSISMGSSQRLHNGNTLIADSERGRAFEVTPDGEIVWDFYCPHELQPGRRAAIVRMIRYPRSILQR